MKMNMSHSSHNSVIAIVRYWKLSSIFSALQTLYTNLDQSLDQVRDWMRVNNLKLNPDKTGVLVVEPDSLSGDGYILVFCTLPERSGLSLGELLDPSAFNQLQLVH